MRVDWAVTCRYAESDGAVGTIVGAGIDVLSGAEFPGMVGVMLAVRLAAAPEELAGRTNEIRVRVLDHEGQPVRTEDGEEAPPLVQELTVPPDGIKQRVSGWLLNPLFAFQVIWIAHEEGSYSIETTFGDSDPHLTPMHILQA